MVESGLDHSGVLAQTITLYSPLGPIPIWDKQWQARAEEAKTLPLNSDGTRARAPTLSGYNT